ncbi:MAG: bifunctional ornithine acetyltransferase/N-acetylglutamate synthase, partial [Planctomycetes bacterium]|nr:bifunctional ornithine acetyltransferase/N-acetylglutamate synthase [Planctomycetota bacterium]
MNEIAGGVLAAKDFVAGAVSCGIKTKAGALDLGVIFSETPAAAAAMFTTNKVCAAPVKVSREHVRGGRARAVVVNSGNANACTGVRGLRDAQTMAQLAANGLGLKPGEVLVASTGIIGRPLPMGK